MRRLILPGIPFLLSFALSLSTAGAHCYWQDSGFFLVAVKELGILYPPGFALYVLLCKAWTMALWFVDFTYAVHLFSAVCAAAAAGTIAVASRDLLRTRGPVFKTVQEDGPLAEWVGASIGCLAASGYTFWASAILAKVYAFYFLILTLLIWRMIRADESGKPRDFTIVAALIGLSWQAHPSAALIGVALILFVGFHRKVVGWKGLLWRTGLAALCAIGPIHLLPLFHYAGGSAVEFGNPGTLAGFFEYVSGSRFSLQSGNYGLEGSRVASVFRFLWEEFLGIGLLLVGAGCYRLWFRNRRLLAALAAWIVPVLGVTVLFKLEGQHDFWFVAAWIPLWLVAAVGLTAVEKFREAAVGLAVVGVVWAVIANRSDLDQRNYVLAEQLGHAYLDTLDQRSTLTLESDDAQSTVLYLQRIRNVRSDISMVGRSGMALPQVGPIGRDSVRYHEIPEVVEEPIRKTYLDRGWGPLFLGGTSAEPHTPWKEPIAPESVVQSFRRERGQFLSRHGRTVVQVRPEPYEKRLVRLLLLARKNEADTLARREKFKEAAPFYESILKLDPWMAEEPTAVYPLAVVYVGLQKYEDAEATFKKALKLDLTPAKRAEAYYFLAALCQTKSEMAEYRAKALASPDLPAQLRAKLEGR
jgi:tetratricopeptide (TPR) repeat protein